MKMKPVATISIIFNFRRIVLLGLATFLLITQPVLAEEALSDDWVFSTSIYGWGAAIKGESATGSDIDITFKDIVDNLDFTFMGNVGVNKGKWGFFTDVIYLNIKDDDSQSLDPILTLNEVQIKSWIVTPVVTYSVIHSDRWRLNILAGARYLWMETELEIDTPGPTLRGSESGDVWDGIVGARGKVKLKDNFYLPFHFDVGTGETKLTWQAYGGVGYKFNAFDIVAGYRYLAWNFDDDDKGGDTFNDLTVSGPIFGVTFQF